MGKEILALKNMTVCVITPDLSDVDPKFRCKSGKKCINESKRATEQVLPQILKKIKREEKVVKNKTAYVY